VTDKTYSDGLHDGIKHVIKAIDKIEDELKAMGLEQSRDLIALKNGLGVLVYKNWRCNSECS
jgi:hypothetical protein